MAKINKDEVVGLCSEIDYELKEEYGTSSRKEVAKIMIDDFETSSEDEAKKLFLQEILSLQKRSNDTD